MSFSFLFLAFFYSPSQIPHAAHSTYVPTYPSISTSANKICFSLNPRGLVPTLSCPYPSPSHPSPLIESTVICNYLDSLPSSNPTSTSLYPSNAFEKAKLQISIDFVTTRIIPAFHRFLQWTEHKPYSLQEAQQELREALLSWIKEADGTGPFFAGREFGMGDVQLVPWAIRTLCYRILTL